jgi:hypothetical protein
VRLHIIQDQVIFIDPASHSAEIHVCSNVYLNICKTYLEKNLDQLESFDASQALDVARLLYKVRLKLSAEALLEAEKKSRNLQNEIEAIKRGEWDDKLIAEAGKPSSAEVPPGQSPKPIKS